MERTTKNAPALLLGAVLAISVALSLVLTSKMTFYQDTWAFLIERRDPSTESLFQPHNEHIVVLPVLIEQFFLRVFGMATARPEYVLLAVALAATAWLLYEYVKRRVGPWLALLAAILILCLGPAWEVLQWPFEIGFVGSMLFGIAMLLALERADRRGDIAACVFLILSFGFSSLGIPFALAACVVVLQGPRESWRDRAYVVLIPVALYAAWYLGWGHAAESHLSLRNVMTSPRFVADSMAVAVGSLSGLGTNPVGGSADPVWGRAMLVALIVLLTFRQRRRPGFPSGLWPVAVAAIASWLLTAFNQFPGREPTASRYQYAAAIFVLMILANLFKDIRLSRRGVIVAAALTLIAVGPNLVVLKDGRDELVQQSVLTRADTAAIEIARRTVDPNFELTTDVAGTPSLVNIYAGKYLEAVDEYGSPAYSVDELLSAPAEGPIQADIVLAHALPISSTIRQGDYRAGAPGENCVSFPSDEGAAAELPVSAGLTRIELAPGPPGAISLRRFAVGGYPVSIEGTAGNSVTTLRIPRDTLSRPWYLHIDSEQAARVCR
jgi:MFS family permease